MNNYTSVFLIIFITCTGCGNKLLSDVRESEKIIQKIDISKVINYEVSTLAKKWINQEKDKSTHLDNSIVSITDEILSIQYHENEVISLTIGNSDHKVICHLGPEYWKHVGKNKPIDKGAKISLVGKIEAPGLMAQEVFILTGCLLTSSSSGSF